MASGKEGGGEVEVTAGAEAEAVARWEVGVGDSEMGLGLKLVSALLFSTDPSKAELKIIGDGEGDENVRVLVLQVMGAMGSSFNASVTGAVQTRLLPSEPLSLTAQKHVRPSRNPRPRSRYRRVHSHIYLHPHFHPPASLG
jgi:hypothetical protein